VYDLFLVSVRDYKLDLLYQDDEDNDTTNFPTYLQGFLIRAIPKFTNCTKDMTNYTLTTTPQFNVTLSLIEKVILADLMVIEWLNKEINDVTQFNLHLSNADFKTYAEANNLKEKSERADKLREKVDKDMLDYGLAAIDWDAWRSGEYS
jgi:hypothetical protein